MKEIKTLGKLLRKTTKIHRRISHSRQNTDIMVNSVLECLVEENLERESQSRKYEKTTKFCQANLGM